MYFVMPVLCKLLVTHGLVLSHVYIVYIVY